MVQTRTGEKTENVSVSSGNCDNVKVGDGQSKTYVPGTTDVSRIHAGADGHSIDIGYTPYDGGGTGVQNAGAAPIPQNTNLAYNWGNNAQGYRTLTQASMTADRIAWATLAVAGTGVTAIAGSELLTATAAARSSVIFRLAHGMRVAAGHGLVLASQAAVRNAVAAAIASGAFQKMGPNAFEGVVYVEGLLIRFTGGWNAAGQMVVSNVMRVLPK